MSPIPTDVETEGGTVTQIDFECERRELRHIVDDIAEAILGIDGMEKAKSIRREEFNPVIKTGRGDMIYFRWDTGRARVKLGMAEDPIPEVVSAYFMSGKGRGAEAKFPWSRGEMSEYARSLIEEGEEELSDEEMERFSEHMEEVEESMGGKLDEGLGDGPDSGGPESAHEKVETVGVPGIDPSDEPTGESDVDEETRRVREEDNHRDEEQKEPRGGYERRGRNQFEIVDGKTAFMPAFDKDEVDYHGPGEGPDPQLDCKDCVNYIEGGGCHVVQGEVDPDGYCEDLFADVGIFGRMYEGSFEINLALWGEMFEDRFARVSFEVVANRIKEAIRKKL